MAVLYGLWGVHLLGIGHGTERLVAAKALHLMASKPDSAPHALANRMMGESLGVWGDSPSHGSTCNAPSPSVIPIGRQ